MTETADTDKKLTPEEQALQDKINKLRGITPDTERPKKKKKPTDDPDDDDDDETPTGTDDTSDDDGESDENEKEDESKELKVQRDPFDHMRQQKQPLQKKNILQPLRKNMPRSMFQQMFDMLFLGKDGVAIRDGKISTRPRIFDQLLLGLGMTSIKKDIELQQQAAEYWRQKRAGITPNKNLLRTDLTPQERAVLLRNAPVATREATQTVPGQKSIEQPSLKRQRETVHTPQSERPGTVKETPKPQHPQQSSAKEQQKAADGSTPTTPANTQQPENQAQHQPTLRSRENRPDNSSAKTNDNTAVQASTLRERAALLLREMGILNSTLIPQGLVPRITANSEASITKNDRQSNIPEEIYDRPNIPYINRSANEKGLRVAQAVHQINRDRPHPDDEHRPEHGGRLPRPPRRPRPPAEHAHHPESANRPQPENETPEAQPKILQGAGRQVQDAPQPPPAPAPHQHGHG